MSLAVSLANVAAGLSAGRGLMAASSENVRGAEVEGFVRRDPTVTNDGVAVRASAPRAALDPFLLRDQRDASALAAAADVRAARLGDLAAVAGDAAGEDAVSQALADLEAAFIALEAAPSSSAAQQSTLDAAKTVVDRLNAADAAIADARARTQADLDSDVARANTLLSDVEALNAQIVSADGLDRDADDLRDRRDATLDELATLIPIATYERAGGDMVVAVKGGPTLLDGTMRPLVFDAAVIPAGAPAGYPTYPSIRVDDPDATAAATDLSDLTGGRIGGALVARDQDLVTAQRQVDALAQGVIAAFQTADASLAPGAAGLFTNAGAAVDPAVTEPLGLAGRIAVNDGVDPQAGGALRRLRDGIAAAPGPSQNADQIRAFMDAFSAATPFPAEGGLSANAGLRDYAADVAGARNTARTGLASSAEAERAVFNTLATERAVQAGVDLDAEAQRLIELEQYYAANAQVLETVQTLLDQLLAAVRA